MQTMYAIHLGSYESFAQNSFLELFSFGPGEVSTAALVPNNGTLRVHLSLGKEQL
jgi:hypothetical protein